MARPAIYGKAMTPAERQARQREAKRAELISAVALIRTEYARFARSRAQSDLDALGAAIDLAELLTGAKA